MKPTNASQNAFVPTLVGQQSASDDREEVLDAGDDREDRAPDHHVVEVRHDEERVMRLEIEPVTHQSDNLDSPIPGDRGAHGPFDSTARRFSTGLWARTHLGWPALAGTVAAGLVIGYLLRARA